MFFKEKLETQNKALRCPLLMSQNEDDCHDMEAIDLGPGEKY